MNELPESVSSMNRQALASAARRAESKICVVPDEDEDDDPEDTPLYQPELGGES